MAWEERQNDKGYSYWENMETGEVAWEKPWAERAPANPEEEPWQYYHDENGDAYWYNSITGESRWANGPEHEQGGPQQDLYGPMDTGGGGLSFRGGKQKDSSFDEADVEDGSSTSDSGDEETSSAASEGSSAVSSFSSSDSEDSSESSESELNYESDSMDESSEELDQELEARFQAMLATPEGQAALEAEKEAILREEDDHRKGSTGPVEGGKKVSFAGASEVREATTVLHIQGAGVGSRQQVAAKTGAGLFGGLTSAVKGALDFRSMRFEERAERRRRRKRNRREADPHHSTPPANDRMSQATQSVRENASWLAGVVVQESQRLLFWAIKGVALGAVTLANTSVHLFDRGAQESQSSVRATSALQQKPMSQSADGTHQVQVSPQGPAASGGSDGPGIGDMEDQTLGARDHHAGPAAVEHTMAGVHGSLPPAPPTTSNVAATGQFARALPAPPISTMHVAAPLPRHDELELAAVPDGGEKKATHTQGVGAAAAEEGNDGGIPPV
mmetsp:Transcript_22561/g.65597  ORF Transcript_22561/g.65597 Transcript_22561/m.65597 type:complete len:504 (-) Transcript_22561:7-1518(-)